MDASNKPVVLLLGEIVLAHKEWDSLRAIAQLRQLSAGSRDQFLRDLKDGAYDGVVAISRTWDSTEITGRFDQTLVDLLPKSVKFISHNGAGYDSINATACAARGIMVSNTPGAVDASTASVAIWLMLGALRRAHIPYTATRAGNWRGRMQLTHDPENKVLGILGMGGIGSAFAKRAIAFGMAIQYHNRHELSREKNTVNAKYVDFEELLRTSDVISVHLPLNESTKGMLGKKEFELMKDGVVVVNTARGPIMDEGVLVEMLESGKVWGAGLDVYEKEPTIHQGLLRNDNCVLMPHVGTASFETQRKMEELVIKNLRSAITEGKLATPVAESKATLLSEMTVAENAEMKKQECTPVGNTILAEKGPPAVSNEKSAGTTTSPAISTKNASTGTSSPEQFSNINATPRSQSEDQLTRDSSISTLGSPAIPIIDAVNPEYPSPVSSYANSNPDTKIGPTDSNGIMKLTANLWTAPPLAATAKKEYNWLELSPPLKPKDKEVLPLMPKTEEKTGVVKVDEVHNEATIDDAGDGGKAKVNGVTAGEV